MNVSGIITVISLIIAISNGIGMILMYLRYVEVTRGAFAVLRATTEGEIEIGDLLFDRLKPPDR